jgi:hypothetical protein
MKTLRMRLKNKSASNLDGGISRSRHIQRLGDNHKAAQDLAKSLNMFFILKNKIVEFIEILRSLGPNLIQNSFSACSTLFADSRFNEFGHYYGRPSVRTAWPSAFYLAS